MKQTVSGTFKPGNGDYDGMHSFQSRKSDGFGGKMNDKVNEALRSYYKTYNKNPYVSSLKVTMDDSKFVVNWEVTIEESPDGKAYIGITSRGGAGKSEGSGGSISRAWNQIKSKKKDLPGEISKKMEIADFADYNFKAKIKGWGIRQVFIQYTNPDTHPYLPKSPDSPSGTVGITVGPTPVSLDTNGQVLLSSSVSTGSSTTTTTPTTTTTTTTSTTPKVGSVDGTSINTGGSPDFVTLKDCFITVPPRRSGSVPIFIFYPKNENFETDIEISEKKFSFKLDELKVQGTQSGIKLADRIIKFNNKLFKPNNNSLDQDIFTQTESPVKEWFKKYVMVFANESVVDFNKLAQEVISDIESRSLLPSSFNVFLYGESTLPDTPVMQQIPNITSNIKTLTLIEPVPNKNLVDIATKIKANGGRTYYIYNPTLFNINMNDIDVITDTGTFSFNSTNGQTSFMFPNSPTGLTLSFVDNPVLVASGLTTSFWQTDLPISIQKVGSDYQLKYGNSIITKPTLATGPTGSENHLIPFLPGGIYEGFSPRGLIFKDGELVNKGPASLSDLNSFRRFFHNLTYENKDWIFSSTGTQSGTGPSASLISSDLGITFSFRHKALDKLIPFTYTKLSDDLIKSGAYVYDVSKTAEYNRERAGGESSGWPELIQQPPSLITSSQSGTTPSSLTASYTVRYLDDPSSSFDIDITPQLSLQIFSYDIENLVGKSANPNQVPAQIPKVRGQFIFDVTFKGIIKNDQLGEFKIVEKVEVDPFIVSTPDDLSGLSPEFLEEAFAGEEESLDDDLPSDDLKTFLGELYNEEESKLEEKSAQQTEAASTGQSTSLGAEQSVDIEGKIKVSMSDAEIFWNQLASYNGKKEKSSNAGDPVSRFLKDVGLGVGNPWCMAFVYSMFKEFCDKKGLKNPLTKTGGTKYFWSQTPSKHKILASAAASNPSLIKGGQIFIKSRDGGGHTGIVIKADGPNHFISIDGNSSDSVRLNRYTISSMIGFIDYFSNPYFSEKVSELATPLLKSSKIEKGGGKET